VKQLAMQTARSTAEIARHIDQVRSATGASVAAVARIDQTIAEINSIAGAIAVAVKHQEVATAEIARNVVDTAEAANEITGRTSDASHEAADTGRHAVDLRDSVMALNHAVEELRHSLIKVVRTSTAEVDRRQTRRYPVDIAGGLSIDQGQYQVRASDLAEGGACVSGAPAMPAGSRGALRLDGVSAPLPCIVRSADADGLHLAFELDDAAAAALRPVLDRLELRRAA
jgi:hypothetical protein